MQPPDPAVLLNRVPYWDSESVLSDALDGKSILITGAAGTIGSALTDWLAYNTTCFLTLVDRCERQMVRLHDRLQNRAARFVLDDLLSPSIDSLFALQPDIVIHCAAYKHVPFLENQQSAAWRNNVGTTEKLLSQIHYRRHLELCRTKFVLISTDKAVNPSCVMGRTKAQAERVTLAQPDSLVVRFGNVFNSSGSVIERWMRAVELGLAIEVTDPDMTRYFMTLDEACALVLSATLEDDAVGGIVVPDMGEPVRLGDLADRFCELYECEQVITERRIGEKQHEQLVTDDEQLVLRRGNYGIYRRELCGVAKDDACSTGKTVCQNNQ